MGIISKFFKQAPEPTTKETAETFDDVLSFFGSRQERYNPDILITRKGGDIYRKMLRDPQVKSAYNLLIDILISRAFRFEKPELLLCLRMPVFSAFVIWNSIDWR